MLLFLDLGEPQNTKGDRRRLRSDGSEGPVRQVRRGQRPQAGGIQPGTCQLSSPGRALGLSVPQGPHVQK